jgi:hypothetical protein
LYFRFLGDGRTALGDELSYALANHCFALGGIGRDGVTPHKFAVVFFQDTSIGQADAAIQSDKFIIIDRQRLISWQRRFNEQLQSVKELLLA